MLGGIIYSQDPAHRQSPKHLGLLQLFPGAPPNPLQATSSPEPSQASFCQPLFRVLSVGTLLQILPSIYKGDSSHYPQSLGPPNIYTDFSTPGVSSHTRGPRYESVNTDVCINEVLDKQQCKMRP